MAPFSKFQLLGLYFSPPGSNLKSGIGDHLGPVVTFRILLEENFGVDVAARTTGVKQHLRAHQSTFLAILGDEVVFEAAQESLRLLSGFIGKGVRFGARLARASLARRAGRGVEHLGISLVFCRRF